MRKIFSIFILCSFIVSSCYGTSWAQAGQGIKHVADIKVKGNSSVSTATIVNKLKLKPGDRFEESALNKELKRLYATGYFADVFVETEDREEGVVVLFTVIEKPVIDKVEFRGNSRVRTGRLMKKVSVKEGMLLDFNLLGQDVASIKTYYTEKGYSSVEVDYKIEPDPDTGKATVVFVVDEGRSLKIRSITFEGNKSIPTKELRKYMGTKTAWWFIRKGAFDEEQFQTDQDRIRTLYRSRGFLDASVSGKVDIPEGGQDIHLTIIVEEGKKYLVGEVTIEGELAFPEETIRKKIKVVTDDDFDYTKIREDIDDVRAFYYDSGYMNAEVDLRHKYNSSTERMDLFYDIRSHEVVYVGRINIIGNSKTKDKVIRRELRAYPGARYDGEKLKKSKERIYNLGFFEDVYFETIPTDQPDVKDLNVTVKESKTGELSFGGGYSSVDAFIGFVQIRQRNFDMANFPTFTGSGQDLVLRAEAGSTRTNFLLSWTDPWILDYPLLFGFDVYRKENTKSSFSGYDFDEVRTGGSLRLGKELTDNLSTALIYNVEQVDLSNIPENSSQDLQNEDGENLLSRLTWNIKYDARDNRYSPSKGFVTGMSLENVGGFLLGDKDFVKGSVYGSIYHSIIENVVLEVKGRGGLCDSYGDTDDVPVYERFYAGGATTIRGYEQRAVGPRDSVDTNIPIGGEVMLIGNVEVVFPIYKNLIKGATFYDVGNVWRDISNISDSSGYKQGAGVGIRVKTPIGPVKLDYGYPLNENHDDKREGRFYFSVSHGF